MLIRLADTKTITHACQWEILQGRDHVACGLVLPGSSKGSMLLPISRLVR